MHLVHPPNLHRTQTRLAAAFTLALAALCTGTVCAQQPSVARQWNEELLDAIRGDFARPTVHARNLWHVSIAMWDAWAAYDDVARTYIHHERQVTDDVGAARAEALSYASYRILRERFKDSPGAPSVLPSLDARLVGLGYDKNFISTNAETPAALGNRIAATVIAFGLVDGSNEAGDYVNRVYEPVNPPLLPAMPGNPDLFDPNRWQPLALMFFVDQSGNVIPTGFPEFLGPEWGQVSPFALGKKDLTFGTRDDFDYFLYHDPGPPPLLGGATEEDYKAGFEMVSIWSSHLDPSDGIMCDISPGAIGNARLPEPADWRDFYNFSSGGDWGTGHAINSVTGEPYAPNIVPRGDYARVLAEFWADGPDSETPPGHWFVIANYVSDHPQLVKQLGGQGEVLNDLEWDVKLYFALAGAMHDCAVAAWGVKGWYDYLRPVSAIRYLADQGQASLTDGPAYDPGGTRLYPGLIEVVTAESSATGERHAHLADDVGKVALYAWRGPDYIGVPATDVAGVGWILAENWWPYQRPSFVTPPFAGYVSGHSTYSRAGAVVLTTMTGSPYFPGGVGEFTCPKNEFLVFEDGPSIDITLQWATYNDASDQTSLSRIWGGIHPPADDLPGRHMGQAIGEDALVLAATYFGIPRSTRFRRGEINDDGTLDVADAVSIFTFLFQGDAPPGCAESADVDNSGEISITDGIALLGYLFLRGAAPAAPGSLCGTDTDIAGSEKDLGCTEYSSCPSEDA
jgi:hypothetical protein